MYSLVKNKKWVSGVTANPLILLVPRDRIELPTRGFSVPIFIFPVFPSNSYCIDFMVIFGLLFPGSSPLNPKKVGLLWGWNPEEVTPMASEKIPTQFPGVRFRYHKNRKYNGSLDKYFFIRYHVHGKLKEEGIGWASEDWNAKKKHL